MSVVVWRELWRDGDDLLTARCVLLHLAELFERHKVVRDARHVGVVLNLRPSEPASASTTDDR